MIVKTIWAVIEKEEIVACSLDGFNFYEVQNGAMGSLPYYTGVEGQEIVELNLSNMLIGEGGVVEYLERTAC